MDQIIVITNTDMSKQSGNVTLLERRAEAMYAVSGVYTRILVYQGVPQERRPIRKEFYSVDYMDSREQLEQRILEAAPKHIILYGRRVSLLTFRLHRFLKKNRMESTVIQDVQGCVEEKWEYAQGLKQKLKYPAHYLAFWLAINDADGAFVVSDEMIDNCEKKRLRRKKPMAYYKVRCGVNQLISLEEKMTCRQEMRREYGISDDTVVFVYSGYRMPWQKLDEIMEHMQRFDARLEKAHFMFFCDTDPEFEAQVAAAFPKGNYTVKFLGREEYTRMMCACDVGYLLRDYTETNRVAFPNKFSEYLSCGLLIAMNGALPEPIRIMKHHGVAYIDADSSDMEKTIQTVRWYMDELPLYFEQATRACRQELLYDAQIRQAGL